MRKFKEFYLNHEQVLNSACLVKEPIDQIINKFNGRDIALIGPKKSGKTLTALAYKDKLNSKLGCEVAIYNHVNRGLSARTASMLNESILEQHIELELANDLYNFIKERDLEMYSSRFLDKHTNIILELEETNQFITGNSNCLGVKYKTGDIVKSLILLIRHDLGVSNMTFILDKLDYQTPHTQQIVNRYLPMFDSSILLLNDSLTNDKSYYNQVKSKGYKMINLEYSRQIKTIKEIINRRIALFNQNNPDSKVKNIEELVLKDILDKNLGLIEGNIEAALISTRVACDYLISWDEEVGSEQVTDAFLHNLSMQMLDREKVKKIHPKAKLHF